MELIHVVPNIVAAADNGVGFTGAADAVIGRTADAVSAYIEAVIQCLPKGGYGSERNDDSGEEFQFGR